MGYVWNRKSDQEILGCVICRRWAIPCNLRLCVSLKRFIVGTALLFFLTESAGATLTPILLSVSPLSSGQVAFNYEIALAGSERLDPAATNGVTCRGSSSRTVQCNPRGTFVTIYDIPGFVSATTIAADWSVIHKTFGLTPSSIDASFDDSALTNVTFTYSGPVVHGLGSTISFSGFQIISTAGSVNEHGHFSSQSTHDAGGASGLTIQSVGSASVPSLLTGVSLHRAIGPERLNIRWPFHESETIFEYECPATLRVESYALAGRRRLAQPA